uniref:Complement component 3 n=1 Tax=Pinctada fucata TaxID=50426 RepID=A0A8E6HRE2_PINFU|nr:complement component 3 [Pinctada fucata]
MDVFRAVFLVFSAVVIVNCSPRYLIMAPSKLRYNVPEVISISVTEIRNLPVLVRIQDYPQRQHTVFETYVTVNEDQFTGVSVRIHPNDLPESDEEDRQVYLTLQSTDPSLPLNDSTVVPLTKVTGYIFIQTDKPIYTPDQEVKFRVIPLDDQRLPMSDPVQIDVVNPQGVVIQRWISTWQQKFISHDFQLPDIPVLGKNWTIKTQFTSDTMRAVKSTVEFEVTEYVLPRFSVEINTGDVEIILPTTNNLTIDVTARFVYGKPVQGDAGITFGVKADGRYEYCPFVYKKPLQNGSASFEVDMAEVGKGLESFWFPDGAKLFIEAEVLETTSGRKERAMDMSIVFVEQPFVLSADDSKKFFKPGLTYELKIKSSWANKKVAPYIPVNITLTTTTNSGAMTRQFICNRSTDADGSLRIPVNTQGNYGLLRFQIKTNHPDYTDEQQTEITFDTEASVSSSGQFLKIISTENGTHLLLAIFISHLDTPRIFLTIMYGSSITELHVMPTLGTSPVTYSILIQPLMSPYTRVIAHYFLENPTGPEIVSDSLMIHLPLRFQAGELTLSSEEDVYLPGDSSGANIHVRGAPNSVVGFVAVDEAIYLLSEKGILNKELIEMSMRDRTKNCENSGGRSSRNVFENSGTAVLSNAITPISTDETCHTKSRDRRSVDNFILAKFSNHPCCVAGDLFSRNISDVSECYEEGKEVYTLTNSSKCSKVFYFCCKIYSPVSSDLDPGKMAKVGQKEYTFSDVDDNDQRTKVRSDFPESWMFQEDYLDHTGDLIKNVQLPDSITTHRIQVLSISPDYGISIADPITIATYKDFFIDLDLPYSIVRLEQTEVRAIVYNYGNQALDRVRVRMKQTDGICASKSKRGYVQVRVPANGAEMVRFPIVPLRAGEFDIEISARFGRVRDRIRKKILVINEGREKVKSVSFWLDPLGQKGRTHHEGDIGIETSRPTNAFGVQKTSVDLMLPEEAIPGTGRCKVTAVGNIMDSTSRTVIEDVEKLMNKLPHGCGEQTMINLAPIVYAMRYLVNTGQINANMENKGARMIQRGYQKELLFRKDNGSFGTWPHKPSSTWLTAFVLKVFCEAQRYSHIDPMVICTGMEYLFSRQRHDGSFDDEYPVYHKEMLGGNIGRVSRTAFILIALLECDCRPPGTDEKIRKTVLYLENSLDYINQVYPLSITTYALSLAYSNKAMEANEKLRTFAIERPYSANSNEGLRYWTVSNDMNSISANLPRWYRRYPEAIDVEVTSYALLAQMELNEIHYSGNIVEWLLQNRQSSGAFISTQDTIIALQALTMYNIRTYARDLDLRLTLQTTVNDTFRHDMTLSQGDMEIEKSVDKIPLNGKLNVTTEGSGVARMEVEVRYNVNVSEHETCKFHIEVFDSDVDYTDLQKYGYRPQEFECDVCGSCEEVDMSRYEGLSETYNVPDLNPRIRGLAGSGSRVGRSIWRAHGASKQQICMEICVSYLGYEKLDMPIIDIGLPTGFRPQQDDFRLLVEKGVIDKYEISKRSVTLYLADIPSDRDLCFKFRTVKEFEVENLQSAKIEVFDYYKSDERCVKFYSLKYDVADLDIFCSRSECHCVDGSCADNWDSKLQFRQISRRELLQRTCREYDYVARIEVANVMVSGNHLMISTVVHSAIKAGPGNIRVGDELVFWMNLRCTTSVSEGEFYIIYGKAPIQYVDEQGFKRYRYYLQGDTAIMKDYVRQQYAATATLRYWRRFLRRLERYIRRRGCS